MHSHLNVKSSDFLQDFIQSTGYRILIYVSLPYCRADYDWGICQIDAVRDYIEINSSEFLGLVTFGDHCLHHIFPTIDHWNLHHLYPVF